MYPAPPSTVPQPVIPPSTWSPILKCRLVAMAIIDSHRLALPRRHIEQISFTEGEANTNDKERARSDDNDAIVHGDRYAEGLIVVARVRQQLVQLIPR